ncbi:MAG: hypothetical protein ACTHMS_10005 [Jatrophihabitans sp.]|uniref:hypothetical protein n=1 Tax=Jatrophihabitans sp. TaxID=1932789 RepID=UPI003F81F04A
MTRRAVLAGVVAAGVALGGAAVVDASAAGAATPANQVTIRVSNTHIGFSSGRTIRPGAYTFKVVSADGKDHTIQIGRLHAGYSLQQAEQDLGKSFSGDTAAIRRVDSRITFRGGAEAHKSAGWFSTTLGPARYVVLDQDGGAVRFLTVAGARRAGGPPRTSGTSTAYSYGFGAAGRLPANGWVRLYNQSDQPHFWVFQQVKPGTTARQVRRYFSHPSDAQPSWALSASTNSGVISPYFGEAMHLDLPAGEYVVACFWPDDDSGMPHAFMGMWQIVHLS